MSRKTKNNKNKTVIIVAIVLILAIILGVGGYIIFHTTGEHYYDLMEYRPKDQDSSIISSEEAGKYLTEIDDNDKSQEDSPEDVIAKLEKELDDNAEELNRINPIKSDSCYNILLIGTDARDNSSRGRSDTMILLSINTTENKIFATSFLRDIYVSIPGVGNNRLNAAYVYGGASLLIDTIEQNFGIKIDNYMQTNFFTFIEIIDKIGSVELEVTAEEITYMNKYIREINQLKGIDKSDGTLSESDAGLIALNGKQALAYARIRYIGTDFARTERQRKVLMEVAKIIKKMSKGERVALLNEALPYMVTDITENEFKSMILKSSEYVSYQIKGKCIPVNKTWSYVTINGMSVIGIDFDANRKEILNFIYPQST